MKKTKKVFRWNALLVLILISMVACNDNDAGSIQEDESSEIIESSSISTSTDEEGFSSKSTNEEENTEHAQSSSVHEETSSEVNSQNNSETSIESTEISTEENYEKGSIEEFHHLVQSEPADNGPYADIYAELDGKDFVFSSGAGAWQTQVLFFKNGYFSGQYSDSDMGDSEGPQVIYSQFHGKFDIIDNPEDKIYTLEIKELYDDNAYHSALPDENGVIANYEYVFPPYGFEDAEEFSLYLPYSDISNENPEFTSWVQYSVGDLTSIDRFVLRNLAWDYGFFEAIPE